MTTETRADRDVAAYYDRNTRRFLAFGGGGGSLSIHRELWAPGVRSAREASERINVEIGDAIERMRLPASLKIMDFGCGVGGTLFSLAARFRRARLTGVTISRRQHERALAARGALGLDARCDVVCDDFESARVGGRADVVIAVEAFAHARSRSAFLENAARHLKPRGRLLIVDDFVAERTAEDDADVHALRRGWRLPRLGTAGECVRRARPAGFSLRTSRDLTALIRLDRPRERLIAAIAPVLDRCGLARWPFFANFIGGGALTRALASGAVEYRWLELELTSDPNPAGADV